MNSIIETLKKRKYKLNGGRKKHVLHRLPRKFGKKNNSSFLDNKNSNKSKERQKDLTNLLNKKIKMGKFPMIENCDLKLGRAYLGFFVPLLDKKGNLIFEKTKIPGKNNY